MSTDLGRVTEADRQRMAQLVEDLRRAEVDQPVTGELRDRAIASANRDRTQLGLPPLQEEQEITPEEGFYERARALGMRRCDR